MTQLVWVSIGGCHFRRGSRVATVGHLGRNFFVDGPAQFQIQDVASGHPGDHEEAEGDIATRFKLEVLEDFRGLVTELADLRHMRKDLTYRQQKVHNIHQTQHHVGDIVEAVNVR